MPIDVTQATLDFYKSHPKAMKAGLTDDDIMARHAKLPGMQQWNIENTARRVKQAEDVQRQITEQAEHDSGREINTANKLPYKKDYNNPGYVDRSPTNLPFSAVGKPYSDIDAAAITRAQEAKDEKKAEQAAEKAKMSAPMSVEEKQKLPGGASLMDEGEFINELSKNSDRLSPFGPGKSSWHFDGGYSRLHGDPSNIISQGGWTSGVNNIVRNIKDNPNTSEYEKHKELLALSGQVRDVMYANIGNDGIAGDLASLKLQEWLGNITNEEMKEKAQKIAEDYRQRQMKLLDSSSIWDTDGPRSSIGASQE